MLLANLFRDVHPAFGTLEREFGRLFGGFSPPLFERGYPAVNVWTGKDAVRVFAEIPGVDPADLDITVEGRTLTIRGRRAPGFGADDSVLRHEREHGEFTRAVRLPFPVNAGEVEAACRDGVLAVTLPRAEESRARKIAVS